MTALAAAHWHRVCLSVPLDRPRQWIPPALSHRLDDTARTSVLAARSASVRLPITPTGSSLIMMIPPTETEEFGSTRSAAVGFERNRPKNRRSTDRGRLPASGV